MEKRQPKAEQPLLQQTVSARPYKSRELSPPATTETTSSFITETAATPAHNLRIIGVFHDLYILCQGSEGLVVIDQHAAHERLLYERLRKQYLGGKVASQTIMFALVSLLEQFGIEENNRSRKGSDLLDNILATMACKAAVKANTTLSHREIEALLDDMAAADLFSHCPHGRPVVRIFSGDDVKKWFYRT